MHIPLSLTILLFIPFSFCESFHAANFPKNISQKSGRTARVSGGSAARQGQFPHMVFFTYTFPKYVGRCSASLIAADKVLTAAHCFIDSNTKKIDKNPENAKVIAGATDLTPYFVEGKKIEGLQTRTASCIYVHPDYDHEISFSHDIAFVQVYPPFEINPKVTVIPLAKDLITKRTTCQIQGWGEIGGNKENNRLMFSSSVNVLPISNCTRRDSGPFVCIEKNSRANICEGDSGGPLVCNNKVYGVASHMLPYDSNIQTPECDREHESFFATFSNDDDLLDCHGYACSAVFKCNSGTAHNPCFTLLISFVLFLPRHF